ncbi:MAG TPA: hypothetical protein VLM84_05785, partial [Chromatiaceae bacterium]|nr:hypothetical protein [Chromatiaceae bacterium]
MAQHRKPRRDRPPAPLDSSPGQALVAPTRPLRRRRGAGDDPAGPEPVAGVDRGALRERLDAGLAALGIAANQAQR